jgi:hypothetical protein
MEIAYQRTDDYLEAANDVMDQVEEQPQLKVPAQVKKTRANTLRRINGATGRHFHVVTDGGPSNAAAFVKHGDSTPYIMEHTLDDSNFARYAAIHEKNHLSNGVRELDIRLRLKYDHIKALERATGLQNLESIDLLEGFNDLQTIKEVGRNNKSGYLDEEVPAAERLEKLAAKLEVGSLLELFKQGKVEDIYERLLKMAELVMFYEKFQLAS